MSVLSLKRLDFLVGSQSLKQIVLVLAAIFVLFFSAQISIPFEPVPLTFQSATVLLIAFFLSPKQSLSAIAGYLFLGALGLPVFAEFLGGLPILLGPTGGYLLGFLPAVFLVSSFSSRWSSKNVFVLFALSLLGTLVIFASGLTWLAHFTTWSRAYQFGVQPFYLTESLKLLLLVAVVRFLKK